MTHPRADETYRPSEYWGNLHETAEDLGVVGYPTLPEAFNRHVYANAAIAVLRALRAAGVVIRDRSILDVGTGTGFWVAIWQREGAATVAGSDLVPAAVERLRGRFPGTDFTTTDIAENAPFPGSMFDVVTAMSVLHHIVDEGRFRRALGNLSSQLTPNGQLIVLDPLVVRKRWMPTTAESAHNVARTRAQWESALNDSGMRLTSVFPAAALLSDPVDAGSRAAFFAHRLWWRALTASLQGRDGLAEMLMAPLAALDRALVPRLRSGPGAKVLVIERTG